MNGLAKACGTVLLLVSLGGCSSSGSNTLSLFPSSHCLIPDAKALKSAYPAPLALPRELEKGLAPAFIVEPGDTLLVQPVNLDSPVRLPGDQPVLADGTINLGRYGHPVVAGKTVPQIEVEVRALIEAQTKDAGPLMVRLVNRQSKVYYVLGEVNAPGAYPLSGRETVLDAITTAGGLNSRASRKDIILSRPTRPGGCRVVLPICYQEIVQLGDTSTNYQIAAGDRIFVPTRSLCDDLFGKNKSCPPCGRPQSPCPFPAEPHLPTGHDVNSADEALHAPMPLSLSTPVPVPYPASPNQR
jgi:protein involved in polysaccharide export with SLBB domain